MKKRITRRMFLQGTAAAAGVAGLSLVRGPVILAAAAKGAAPSDKLGIAVLGCGIRGSQHLDDNSVKGERLVAIVDVDENTWSKARGAKTFFDYRKMFDECHKDIDAVFIATPNHHHFLPSMIAMQLGKGVYTEKPMGHTIQQIRQLAEASLKYKVPTQMGNQGHCDESYARLCEYIWAGAIGKVTEVHCWTDRNNGGFGGRPPTEPVPAGLHWEEWIGPSVYRDYHKDLHPHEFHNWYDFGNGSLGNMACHTMDSPFGALKLKYPTVIECEASLGGTDEKYPFGTRIRYDFPARGDLPPVKLYWYDGDRPGDNKDCKGDWASQPPSGKNRPGIVEKFEKENPGRNLTGGGSYYVGDKGLMYSGTWGESPRILPEAKMKEFPVPPKSLPRPKGSFADFLAACHQGKPVTYNPFSVAAGVAEVVVLGNLAQKAGVGKKVEWDGEAMKCTNIPELNKMVSQEYRKGWSPA